MAENQKETGKEFHSFFEGTPCGEMMRKMMERRKDGRSFPCAEMMPKMIALCRKFMDPKQDCPQKSKEAPAHNE